GMPPRSSRPGNSRLTDLRSTRDAGVGSADNASFPDRSTRMWLRIAASAAFAIASCLAARAQSRDISSNPAISLDAAFARVAHAHPQLRLFGARHDGLDAERARASLRPAQVAGAGIDNALVTGKAIGLYEAEITLCLASVFER